MPEFKTRIQELPQQPTNPERPAADRNNPRESSAKRRKVSRRQPARTNSSQSAGVDGDRIQLLRRNNLSENSKSKVPINALLSQPLASESSTATDPDLSFKRSANGVKFESLKTLNPGLWLKSDVINSFAMNIIRPLVRNRRVHFFSTYFFSKLLDTGPQPHGTQTPSYKFDEVKRWGDRLSNGILGVKELIMPINHRNVHWLCLKVSMANKSVMLWDSSGIPGGGLPICYGKLAPIVLNQPAPTGPNLIGHCPPNVRPRPPLEQALAPLKSDRNGGDKTTAMWWWAATVSGER
eukprot:scaffold5297_cov108-Skeletonema_marinoi.AAC.9